MFIILCFIVICCFCCLTYLLHTATKRKPPKHLLGCRSGGYFLFTEGATLTVLYQLQPLFPIERELVVITDERNAIAEGVRDDEVVAWVIVMLRLVDFKAGVTVVMLLVQIEYLEASFFLHRAYHFLWRLPPSSDVWLAVPQQHKLPK